MAAHSLAKDILQKIIVEKTPFSLALKQAFKKGDISKEDRSVVSAVVGCALRHFIVMERLIKDAYPEIGDDGLPVAVFSVASMAIAVTGRVMVKTVPTGLLSLTLMVP